jgi:ribosome maturation factor RimP
LCLRVEMIVKRERMEKHQDVLSEIISPVLLPLGLEVVTLDANVGKQSKLTVYIEHKDANRSITIDDCVIATKAINPVLDTSEIVDGVFRGGYELEVSSPGLDRPLLKLNDFEKFKTRAAQIYTSRDLSQKEMANEAYFEKHPKQRSFSGNLAGVEENSILFDIRLKKEIHRIKILFEVVSKAHLDLQAETQRRAKK